MIINTMLILIVIRYFHCSHSIFESAYENVPEVLAFLDKGGILIDTGWKDYSDSFSKQMKGGMTRGV